MKMKDKEQKSIVYKVNCMILFNMEFEGFQNFIEHEDRTAVAFYKNGKFTKAV
jgi:hypothetical protein